MNKVYTVGDTIRLRNKIKGYDNLPMDPDSLTVNIYSLGQQLISSTPIDLVNNRLGIGQYYLDIVAQEGILVYEWHAIKNGKDYKKRQEIEAGFIGYW